MSTKEQTWEPGVMLTCDHPGVIACGRQVRRAPCIVVPSRTPLEPGHRPMKIMTTLHFCDEHRNSCQPGEYWNGKNKQRLDTRAAITRPHGWRPDFEASTIELVLVTTPEYRAFLAEIGVSNVEA